MLITCHEKYQQTPNIRNLLTTRSQQSETSGRFDVTGDLGNPNNIWVHYRKQIVMLIKRLFCMENDGTCYDIGNNVVYIEIQTSQGKVHSYPLNTINPEDFEGQ